MKTGFDLDSSQLWIGRHRVDGDTLIFDPALPRPPHSPYVALFSLNELRPRSFPLEVLQERVVPITDESERAEALRRYQERTGLRETQDRERQQARDGRIDAQRTQILDRHRSWFEEQGREYPGLEDSAASKRKSARKVCGACGIPLDDFLGVRCKGCGILCSCGACACTAAPRAAS